MCDIPYKYLEGFHVLENRIFDFMRLVGGLVYATRCGHARLKVLGSQLLR